ncbi:zinc-binding dehydrogenase, partial [Mesorhizobium sp. M1338]|uniref:zinc-binding dehydrogenase n=1 Tax=Mesorhizobium sp. M1338 TaxID=2957085 RepID=UPI003338D6A2
VKAVTRAVSRRAMRAVVPVGGRLGAFCMRAARAPGGREIVATDVMDGVLAKALEIGADRAINVATNSEKLAAYNVDKGTFDVMFEASGNERAVRAGLDVLKPRGVLVQLGLGGDVSLPQNLIVAKEIEMRGSFRFHEEFALAVDLINSRRVDVKPLLTGVYPLDQAVAAFEIAGDRSKSIKVQIAF